MMAMHELPRKDKPMNQDYSAQIGAAEDKVRELLAEVTKLREMAEGCKEEEKKPHQELIDKFLMVRPNMVGWKVTTQRENCIMFERGGKGVVKIMAGGYSGLVFDSGSYGMEVSYKEMEVLIELHKAMLHY